METTISINIHLKGADDFVVTISNGKRVIDLKAEIQNKSKFPPSQQRLVFMGRVLKDDLSLAYYGIKNSSSVYLVPAKVSKSVKSPKLLIARLKALVLEAETAGRVRTIRIHEEIRELINDPILTAFAPLSKEACRAIEEGRQELEYDPDDLSDESTRCLAQQADTALNQIEGSFDGLRVLQQLYDDEINSGNEENDLCNGDLTDEEEEIIEDDFIFDTLQVEEPIVIPKKAEKISTAPLPTLRVHSPSSATPFILPTGEVFNYELSDNDFWCENDFKKYVMQKYSQQVAILKKMGFDDEQNIIQALGETNGNVQLAFQILRNHLFFQC